MTHRCRVKGCPFGTRCLPWHHRHYVCPFHRHDLDDDLLIAHTRERTHR